MTGEAQCRALTIVGGAGFLGQSLISRLATDSHWADLDVRCVDRVPVSPDVARPQRFHEYVGDAHDPHLLAGAIEGVDTVWIRAGLRGGAASADASSIRDYLQINTELVARVLDACDKAGCRRVIFDSSEQVFGDSADIRGQTPYAEPAAGNYYGASKLIAEKLLRMWTAATPSEALRSVQIMRYSRVRAGDTRDVLRVWMQAALNGEPIRVLGNSARRVTFVHLDDVLAANLAALSRTPDFAVYHVAADRPTSLLEIAQRVRETAHAATRRWVPIEVEPGAVPFEPHVVGMQWETSMRELGLPPSRGMDVMLRETLVALAAR